MPQIILLHQILKLQKVKAFMRIFFYFNLLGSIFFQPQVSVYGVKLGQKKWYIITFNMSHTNVGIHKNAK